MEGVKCALSVKFQPADLKQHILVSLVASRDTFLDRTMSKNSRRNFLNQIEKRKYEMNSTVDVDKEAEAEIDQMVNDARKKLDFHSILGKNKKDAESKQK